MDSLNLIFDRVINPLSRKILLQHKSLLRGALLQSMKRPVNIDSISESISKLFANDHISVIEALEDILIRFEEYQISRNGKHKMTFIWKIPNIEDICNLYLAAIRAIAPINIEMSYKLLGRISRYKLDERMLRSMVTFSNRHSRFEESLDFLGMMEQTDWVKNTKTVVFSKTSRVRKPIIMTEQQKWISEHDAILLSDTPYGLHFSMGGEIFEKYKWMQLAGRLIGNDVASHGVALVHFTFLNEDGNKISSNDKHLIDGVTHKLEGLGYSSAVGWYSYLKAGEDGFFLIEFQLPLGTARIILNFRTWKVESEISLDGGLFLTKSLRMLSGDEMPIFIEILHNRFEGIQWEKRVNREVFRILKDINPQVAIKYGIHYNDPSDIAYQKIILKRLEDVKGKGSVKKHLNRLIAQSKLQNCNNQIYKTWMLKLRYKEEIMDILMNLENAKPKLEKIRIENNKSPMISDYILDELIYSGKINFHDEMLQYCIKLAKETSLQGLYAEKTALNESQAYIWQGNITGAIEVLRPFQNFTRVKKKFDRYENMNQILINGFPHYLSTKNLNGDSLKNDTRNVFYLLHNSLPTHSGGYACRSHGIIKNMDTNHWNIIPYSRLGYPWDSKGFRNLPIVKTESFDGIQYNRIYIGLQGHGSMKITDYVSEYANAIVSRAKRGKPIIIQAASNHVNGLAAVMAARILGIKCIYEVRGLWEITRLSRQPKWAGSEQALLIEYLETEAAIRSDIVITLNQAMKQKLITRGVDEQNIHIVPNGVDSNRFKPLQRVSEIEVELELDDKVVIGYVGSIVDYEGLDLLMEAVVELSKLTINAFHVLIVGDGAHLEHIKGLVENLEIEDLVTFTGRVNHEKVESYYSVIDILVFPRKGSEVTEMVPPLKPLEGMSMEKCVLVSDVSALAEMIEDGQTGVIFKKDDEQSLIYALKKCISDVEFRIGLGKSAREWIIQNRDWKEITKSLQSVYDYALQKPSKSKSIRLKNLRLISVDAKNRFTQYKNDGFCPRKELPPWDMSADELDFESDPFNDRNWCFQLNSLRPIDPALILGGYSKDEHFQYALELMIKWIDCDNRYNDISGMRWSDMATGIRALRLAFIIQNTQEHRYPKEIIEKLKDSAIKHIEVMMREVFVKDTNHGLFVVHGLMALCITCPKFSAELKAREWANNRMQELLDSQFDEEGVHVENSPEYHFFIRDVVMGIINTGWYILEGMASKMDKIKQVSCWMIWPNNYIVPVGDSSASKSFKRDWLNEVRKSNVGDLCNENFKIQGKDYLFKNFIKSGYVIVRSPFSTPEESASMLFCLSAFQAVGHRQSDDLSFQLFENGGEIFVDPGKYTYNKESVGRIMVKSARAHNTLEIDGMNYDMDEFAKYDSALIRNTVYEWGTALHFSRYWDKFSTKHQRFLLYYPKEFLIVIDVIKSNKIREFRQWFHISEKFQKYEIGDDNSHIFTGKERKLRVQFLSSPNHNHEVSIYKGKEKPMIGWRSKGYQKLVPIYSFNQLIEADKCAIATGFSLTGGVIDLEFGFEKEILKIDGMINEINIHFDELVDFS